MPNNELDDLLSDEPIEEVKLDLDKVKENVPQYSNEKLCEMIVCDRYFGFDKKISSICMAELSKRRADGSIFNFESYIDQMYNELPVLDFSTPDIRNILKQAMKISK